MSHILDALRKAQDESTGTPRTSVTGSETLIARRGGGRWGGMTRRVWIMAASGVILLAVAGWMLYGPAGKPVERQALVQPAPPPSVAPQSAPTEPPAVAPPVASQPSAAPSAQPVPAAVSAPPPVAQQADQDEEEPGSRNRRQRRGNSQAAGTVPQPASPGAAPSAQPASVAAVAGTPEGIKLTGIAWQENRKLRRAVVNDILVGEGVLVAGAKVVEIRPAAVRFEKNGTVYEVVLPR